MIDTLDKIKIKKEKMRLKMKSDIETLKIQHEAKTRLRDSFNTELMDMYYDYFVEPGLCTCKRYD